MDEFTNGQPTIDAIGLRKLYGQLVAVHDVNLQVRAGEIMGFLGPNGAGKTTTIKILTGLLAPTAGTARICGFNIQAQPLQAKACIGYVPDTPNLYGKLNAWEFLRFIGRLYRVPKSQIEQRSAELLKMFDLEDAAGDLLEGYSHGMQQKMALAGALVHNPQVLFLDEPTVGLDPKSARLIKSLLRQIADRGATVFFSTHILEIAERMCDRVAIINKGEIIAVGTMDELRAGGASGSLEDIFLSLTGGDDYAELANGLS
jgi:ABC-2 type transport system ATP-binding protein